MRRILASFLAAAAFAAASAAAQYPSRPVRLVVPFPAGGPTDGVARVLAQRLGTALGQPVVVENKPGADGAIAAQSVAASAPDGYTLLFATSGVAALPVMVSPAPFDLAAFTPVAALGRFAFALYANPAVPAANVAELVAYARAHPNALNVATANPAEQMATAQFLRATGIEVVRVPYKGASQAVPDLLAGRVHAYFTPLVAGLQQAKDGRLRMLATLLPARSPLAPDVPTMKEAGYPNVFVPSWQMVLAPAHAPREVVARLAAEVALATADPAVRAQLETRGLFVETMGPQPLAAMLKESTKEWTAFVRENPVAN